MVAKKLDLLAIVGPTASGKTALSINIAKKYSGEVISADSRAIYKYLDIGSAKPTKEEQDGVPHWGIDLAGPGANFTVADFKKYADFKIKDIQNRNRLPILVGGSGLYVDSVLYDYSLAPKNDEIRKKLADFRVSQLQEIIKNEGLEMPENVTNKRYLIRVIERGKHLLSRKHLGESVLIIGICPDKGVLESNIELRLQAMIDSGVIEEIKHCADIYGWDSVAMTGGIYRCFSEYIQVGFSLEGARSAFIKSDRLLAKRQMTWFRRNPDIKWFKNSTEALTWFDQHNKGKL